MSSKNFSIKNKHLGILLVGHGSKNKDSNKHLQEMVSVYQAQNPNWIFEYSYLEIAQPSMKDALEKLANQVKEIILFPLFLFAANHIKNDIGLYIQNIRKQFPEHSFTLANHLGVHPIMIQMIWKNLIAMGGVPNKTSKTSILLIGRGSVDADANGDFYKVARLFQERNDSINLFPCFVAINEPSLEKTLEMVAGLKPEKILILPYLLFEGFLTKKIEQQANQFSQRFPKITVEIGKTLGEQKNLLMECIQDRIQNACLKQQILPCDTCKYRVFLPQQSIPIPFKKHILICTHENCASKGSNEFVMQLKQRVREVNLKDKIRVASTSCMGQCNQGIAMVVYPDGLLHLQLQKKQAEQILEDCIQGLLK